MALQERTVLISCLILSPIALMWLVAEFYHPPNRERLSNLRTNLLRPLWQAFTHPVGKQRVAFGQFFVGVAILSGMAAATMAFETSWRAATWMLCLELSGLLLATALAIALASLFYGMERGG
ncbi:hypothetical protein [Bordetella avium]|uniref:hypothetical protein n=1 Tax=Bordetella avium TaxID=521 RepID=UPI000E0BFE31|nr:hypothetical protein [Bordetella avium]AZY48479.1 hypothetical protein C0J09_04570 [Bordetella avium]RIQ13787.1 hypothetical protein D0432_05785 [Bordetella avium]RIQ39483.1 hypothetical protein D0848_03760 [Bordetella avium]RIQ44282.1 hypothetical protein D0847_03750 [Bordetella avium]RIQ45500.1 hypothetical protein D0846_06470 [Bordetella avium]